MPRWSRCGRGSSMTDRTDQFVTPAQLRQLCGAEAGVIEGLIRARSIPVRDGKVGVVAGCRAFLDHVRSTAKAASLSAAAEASRDARAEADEVLVKAADRTLIPHDDLEDAVALLAGAINAAFGVIPARSTRNMPERWAIERALKDVQTVWAAGIAAAWNADPAPRRRGRK